MEERMRFPLRKISVFRFLWSKTKEDGCPSSLILPFLHAERDAFFVDVPLFCVAHGSAA